MRQHDRVGEADRPPGAKRRIGEMGGDIVRGPRADRQVVGGDAGGDGREEDVREAVVAEEPAARTTGGVRARSTRATRCGQRRPHLRAGARTRVAAPKVHRAVPAQRGEARVHLGDQTAGKRAQARLARARGLAPGAVRPESRRSRACPRPPPARPRPRSAAPGTVAGAKSASVPAKAGVYMRSQRPHPPAGRNARTSASRAATSSSRPGRRPPAHSPLAHPPVHVSVSA